ncbi:HAD-IIIC family phosphatase [bacterium]|nr:HAD-IIIC family phosphatase [bacterium]
MQLREARKIVNEAQLTSGQSVNILSSYEPLHYFTFMQAEIVKRFVKGAPSLNSFGFDQLEYGLRETEKTFLLDPAILLMDWADLHPSLSWKSRSGGATPNKQELEEISEMSVQRIERWLDCRPPSSSVLVLPSDDWFPIVDATLPSSFGQSSVRIQGKIWRLAATALKQGCFVIKATGPLDLRSLASAGCPMDIQTAEDLAVKCTALLFPKARRKVLIVDLDNTLWRGVLAEDGLNGIACTDSDSGYPFLLFQKFIQKLHTEGILLAYCSKNDLGDVQAAFASDKVWLSENDFASGDCNWGAKSLGIERIATDLGLGVDSVVFVDDNPAEIAEVTDRLPSVVSLQTPSQVNEWPQFLEQLQSLFWTAAVSKEDAIRTNSNSISRQRHMETQSHASEEFSHLREFKLRVFIRDRVAAEPRTSELLNKTNQFNLTGERVGVLQLLTWSKDPSFFCYSIELEDRYGSFGVIGIIYGWAREKEQAEISNMVVSCRALGRGIEFLSLRSIVAKLGCRKVSLDYRRTARNEPARVFLEAVVLDFKSIPANAGDSHWFNLDTDKLDENYRLVREQTGAIIDDR